MRLRASIRLNAYRIIEDAVERGIAMGWMHAHKHVAKPSEDVIKNAILSDVMGELCEVVEDWGDGE